MFAGVTSWIVLSILGVNSGAALASMPRTARFILASRHVVGFCS